MLRKLLALSSLAVFGLFAFTGCDAAEDAINAALQAECEEQLVSLADGTTAEGTFSNAQITGDFGATYSKTILDNSLLSVSIVQLLNPVCTSDEAPVVDVRVASFALLNFVSSEDGGHIGVPVAMYGAPATAEDEEDPDATPPPDSDGDGIDDESDNCPDDSNPGGIAGIDISQLGIPGGEYLPQQDTDCDGVGDVCDTGTDQFPDDLDIDNGIACSGPEDSGCDTSWCDAPFAASLGVVLELPAVSLSDVGAVEDDLDTALSCSGTITITSFDVDGPDAGADFQFDECNPVTPDGEAVSGEEPLSLAGGSFDTAGSGADSGDDTTEE